MVYNSTITYNFSKKWGHIKNYHNNYMKKFLFSLAPVFLLSIYFYNPSNAIQKKGTIIETKKEPLHGRIFWILKIRTTYGKIFKVELAPPDFMKDFSPKKGDFAEVEGSLASSGNENFMIARVITWKGKKWILRTKEGFPLWRKDLN